MSLMKMPIAAPSPPTSGEKVTAKTAGMKTLGQNLTVPMAGANIPRKVK